MNKDKLRDELAKDDFFPALSLVRDDDDNMYIMVLSNEELCISYTPVKCIYAYGHVKNTIRFSGG